MKRITLWGYRLGLIAAVALAAGCSRTDEGGAQRNAGDARAQDQAAAAQAGRDGRARRDCPPSLSPASVRSSGPVDDIVGVRPGMPYDEVVAVLECRGNLQTFQTAETWSISQNHGFPTRQLLRATDGTPCSQADLRGRVECDSGGNRFEPVKNLSEEFVVAFTGMPGEEIARVIWRRSLFPADGYPTNQSLIEALTEKYGAPMMQHSEMNMQNTQPRHGGINLFWVYNQQGQMLRPGEAVTFRLDCANGMRPWFAARHSWNSGCGLTIRAEIMPVEGSRLVASSLDVMVVDQAALFRASRAMEEALVAAYQEQTRAQGGGAPDM
jgi:hypothetical protein